MRDVAYVALGSNIGDRDAALRQARAEIAALPDTELVAESTIEETAPLGPIDQPPFLNQMVAVRTGLTPMTLLRELQEIELRAGRIRAVRWGPRTLDLDIVYFDRQTVDEPGLTVPHPELPNRDFWQRELAELRASRE